MTSIFLTNTTPVNIQRVFSSETAEHLKAQAGLDTHIYTLQEVLDAPEMFRDVRFIFSTWGMAVMTEEQIRHCFPKLECVFYAAGTVQYFARPFLNCGVKVYSAWIANAVPVAEYTVAQIILANTGYFYTSRLASIGKYADAKNEALRAQFSK